MGFGFKGLGATFQGLGFRAYKVFRIQIHAFSALQAADVDYPERVCIFRHTYIYIYTYTFMCMCIHMRTGCVCVYVYIYIHMNIHLYIYMYTHIHTYTQIKGSRLGSYAMDGGIGGTSTVGKPLTKP